MSRAAADSEVAAGERPGPAAPERRGRPRSAAADSAIIEAVLRLIEDGVSIGELSMERIAREAGVGKATVYRRWSGKSALMLDVMRSLDVPSPPLDGTSVRDDLVALLEFLRRRGLAKRSSALLRTVVSHVQAQPELWAEYHETVVRARHEALLGVLRRGVANGEIRTDHDLETIADLFVGPMLARAILHEWKELPESLSADIVDMVLEGVRPGADAAAG
ncbi:MULTISPECIES: TetR/AcrR family transcriptional regulator [Streptomyces]|uniref:TetR/AcrR family transcriptional regulator n=1 Tax=Streptomyces decoyicus TaxID=249567 RepID=A0ABZ1FMJ2_9ACTN|nr:MULTISPECIES: TetR/AcrR family transcriptional regulator [Streptomyces]WSB71634.1 TetR/AcrR family transcriptional regulator [Streptomyces decoyicus]BDH10584.1 TetR family transcriptional regulator [Streptomyces hygroscopicus]